MESRGTANRPGCFQSRIGETHVKIAILAATFLCASLSTAASAQEIGVKVPALLPHVDDVKTPAPLEPMGPGLPLSMPPTGASMSAHTARQVPASVAKATRHAIDRVFSNTSADGTIWARGRTYKASFDASGVTFVPFFGARAPRNYPLELVTRSVSVGETSVAVGSALPVKIGDTIAFDRGSFVERWQLGVEGIEQQFVFESLPTIGDLVVRVGAETELTPSCVAGSIAFSNDLGRVDYGAAAAVDATGLRFAMKSAPVDGAIELRLDRADVERAVLPLVIDPFVSTFPLLDYGTQDVAPDVAYDATTDRYLVVYEDVYSGTDHDICFELRDSSGGFEGFDFIDYTTSYWASPRVANNHIAANFMCVAAVGAPGNLRTIWGRTCDAATATLGAQFAITGTDTYDKFSPDIGGDPTLAPPTYYMVTWERTFTPSDHDIHGRLIDASGALQGTGTIFLDNSGSTLDERPSISKSDGAPPFNTQNWTIVWQRFNTIYQQYQIFASQVRWDGSITHATYPIDATSDNDLNPRVSSLLDGDGVTRPYMVVFQAMNSGGNWDITGAMFASTTFLVGTNIPNYTDITAFTHNQILPCVDSDGTHFTVAYADQSAVAFNDLDIVAADMVYTGGYPYVCDYVTLPSTPDSEIDPAITSTYSGGGARLHYFTVWDRANFQFGTADVEGALFDGLPGGCAMPFCFGDGSATACPCGNSGASGNGCANSADPNGGNLTWSGNPQVSADSFVLSASGLPHGGTGLFFQGAFPAGGFYGSVFGDGIRCITTAIHRIGPKSNPNGTSQYPESGDAAISLKGAIPAGGALVFYQLWYRNAGSFCTPAPFNLTNGLEVIWAP
jgi:hypothetical protein